MQNNSNLFLKFGKTSINNSAEEYAAQIKKLCVGYGGDFSLKDITLNIPLHQTTVLVGKNGCGKSTLLRALAARVKPLSGEIVLNGKPLDAYAPLKRARQLSYLPQVRDVPNLTVQMLVEHGRYPHLKFPRVLGKGDKQEVKRAMAAMRIDGFASENVAALSGGERQRAYLAMALCQNSDFMLLDEPTTYLDLHDGYEILNLLKAQSQNRTLLMVLHDLDAALRTADLLVLMDGGKIVASGSPKSVYNSGEIQRVYKVDSAETETEKGKRYVFYLKD